MSQTRDIRPKVEETIPFLRVSDAEAASAWWKRMGFRREWVHQFGPRYPLMVAMSRDGRAGSWVFLSEHEGDARPGGLVYVRVRDVDSIAAEFSVDVRDAGWAREIELTDPDGNRIRIGTPTPHRTPLDEFDIDEHA